MAGTDGLDFQTADFDFVAGRNGDLSRALSLGNLIEFIQILQNHKGIFPGIKIRQMIAGLQIMNDAVKMIRMRMGQKMALAVSYSPTSRFRISGTAAVEF